MIPSNSRNPSKQQKLARADNVITTHVNLSEDIIMAMIGDRHLSNWVLYWMMEVFPPLLPIPFQTIQEDTLKKKGDTTPTPIRSGVDAEFSREVRT